jgi:voltage-dependent anion channel protein 2
MNPGVFVSSILCFSLFVLDLLTRDYSTDQKFSISTNSVSGVALTSTALKNGVLHAANVATQYKYRNTFFDVKIDTDFNVKSLVYPMNKFVSIDHNTLSLCLFFFFT